MEQGHVETDMARVQTAVFGEFSKGPVQVRDVIDVRQKTQNLGLTLFRSSTSIISR